MKQFLIIQTASLGDVILSTAIAESLHSRFPDASIDYLVKKSYESLFSGHPFLRKVIVWDKQRNKYRNLLDIALSVRSTGYDAVINVQRFFTSGFITAVSGARVRSGFDKNPLSFTFSHKTTHKIGEPGDSEHETERNHHLLSWIPGIRACGPALYPTNHDYQVIKEWSAYRYITISPASLWFTKQYPVRKWIDFIDNIPQDIVVLLLGAAVDSAVCNDICETVNRDKVISLSGKLSFLQSAAIMKGAVMNYVNDSAPMHLASAVNAPVTAIYCSTVPGFGFGPLSSEAAVVEANPSPDCRPCGLHGLRQCPEGHFNCAETIRTQQLLDRLDL